MGLFGRIRENLQKNKGTLAQKLMGGMGMMQKMPEGMRPRRGEGIIQGMFPRLDKSRMGKMPSIEELVRFARENNLPLPPGLRGRFPADDPFDRFSVNLPPEVEVGGMNGVPGGGLENGRFIGMPKPDMTTMPMMPPTQFIPKPPSKGMPIDPGRMPRFAGGGGVYPNKGLAALAEVAPEVVKRMGYQDGGSAAKSFDDLSDYEKEMEMLKLKNVIVDMPRGYEADRTKMDFINQFGFEKYVELMEDILANERNKNAGLPFSEYFFTKPFTEEEMGGFSEPVTARITQNFPRRSPEMLVDQLTDMLDLDTKYSESRFLPESIFKDEEDLLRNRREKTIGEGAPLDRPLSPAGMLIGQIRDLIMGTDIENDQVALQKVNELRQRLIDNIKAIEDQGGTVDPKIKSEAQMIERRFMERGMPLSSGMKVTETSVEMMPGDNISEMLASMS